MTIDEAWQFYMGTVPPDDRYDSPSGDFRSGYVQGKANAEAALAECERLRQDLAKQFVGMQAYAGCLERKLAECEQEKAELREKLVELALRLAAHETAEDRKRILESEDVRSIMDLRLR